VIASILGGIGLFLLGMVLLTDGLKDAAGDSLREILARFTGGPISAVLAGATVTAVVQSSSATVLTTIGFVSAGLLTFAQSVGVIFGANLGTTSTGWLVAVLGLRFSISAIALPLVGVGALTRLLTRGRSASFGLALAGFGLIFVGIDFLQAGMENLAETFDPGTFPGATILGRLMLVGIGIAMTVVMQSSSAAVATTLTALYTGTIGPEQAAALVVGQSVGTTVTAAIAVIGGSVGAKRTAVAHIMFNLVTGTIGFLLIVPAVRIGIEAMGLSPSIMIAAFLTTFKLLGVLLLLPFVQPFAGAVVRIVPERGPELTRHLDDSILEIPAMAIDTARRTTMDISALLINTFLDTGCRESPRPPDPTAIERADAALHEVRSFLGRIPTAGGSSGTHETHLSVLHAIDHLERLEERLRSRPAVLPEDQAFTQLREAACTDLGHMESWMRGESEEIPEDAAARLSLRSADMRREDRVRTLEDAAQGVLTPDAALRRLDALRWFDSALYHIWRATHHLAGVHARAETEEEDASAGLLPQAES
jgi:phosphate:Na+ symporter